MRMRWGLNKNHWRKKRWKHRHGHKSNVVFLVEGVDGKHENRCIVKKYEEIINTQHIYIYDVIIIYIYIYIHFYRYMGIVVNNED